MPNRRAIWRDEAQSILDLARRELAASQDENKILRGELTAMEHHFAHYRETSFTREAAVPRLLEEKQQLQTRLCQAEEELRKMARDTNTSQAGMDFKIETLETRTMWLQGLLNERERLQADAEAKQDATEKLLSQAGQDLRAAKDYINQLQRRHAEKLGDTETASTQTSADMGDLSDNWDKYFGREHETWLELLQAQEQVDRLEQVLEEAQALILQTLLPSHEKLRENTSSKFGSQNQIQSSGTVQRLASMSSLQLRQHVQDLEDRLQRAEELREGSRTGEASSDTREIHGNSVETVSPPPPDEDLQSKITAMEVTIEEQVKHLVRSKEREFTLARDLQTAQEKIDASQEEKQKLQSEYFWLQAAHDSTTREMEKIKATARSPPASPLVSPHWQRPADVFSDYSPFIPDGAAHDDKNDEKAMLKARVRDLQECLAETESTLAEGRRDMIALLQANEAKDRQIQELLASSFRRSFQSPLPVISAHTSPATSLQNTPQPTSASSPPPQLPGIVSPLTCTIPVEVFDQEHRAMGIAIPTSLSGQEHHVREHHIHVLEQGGDRSSLETDPTSSDNSKLANRNGHALETAGHTSRQTVRDLQQVQSLYESVASLPASVSAPPTPNSNGGFFVSNNFAHDIYSTRGHDR